MTKRINILKTNTNRMKRNIKIGCFKKNKKCRSIWMTLWDKKKMKN